MAYFKNQNKEVKVSRTRESLASINALPIADLSHRGISFETCETFNVRMSVSSEDGETPSSIYFPYYDQKGNVCGWKRKDLTLDKTDKYYITAIGKVGVECKMFGQQVAEGIDRKKSKVILVEGEEDTLISYQALAEWADNSGKYTGLRPFVLGLNCGAGNAVDSVQNNIKYIGKFKQVCLAFDNDEATDKQRKKGIVKGKECTDNVAASLMSDNVMVLDWNETNCKDPNEVYLEEGQDKLAKLLSFSWEKYQTEKVVTANNFTLDEIVEVREQGAYVDTMPRLMEKIQGFRKRELSVFTSLSGVGKTTITSEIAYNLAEDGYKMGMIFLEEETRETIQRMMARKLEVNYNKFKFDPRQHASEVGLSDAFDWCRESERFAFVDHFGHIRIEDFMNIVKFLTFVKKVDYIILDHITVLTSSANPKEATAEIDKVMVELAAFVASHDVGILVISHLNRSASDELKGISRIEEPVWIKVKKEDMRGSSSLEALAWVVMGLDVEFLPDRTRGRVRLTVLKNRPFGLTGECDILKMNQETGILEDASAEF